MTLRHEDPTQITRAAEAYDRGELLNEFVPMPQELKEGDGWYGWCISHWGTKWDVGNEGRVPIIDPNEIELSFDSAWSPPIEAYRVLEELGFEVDAKFYEPGMAFCGTYDGEYGESTYEIGGMTSDTVRDMIGEELDDCFGISAMLAEFEADEEDINERFAQLEEPGTEE